MRIDIGNTESLQRKCQTPGLAILFRIKTAELFERGGGGEGWGWGV